MDQISAERSRTTVYTRSLCGSPGIRYKCTHNVCHGILEGVNATEKKDDSAVLMLAPRPKIGKVAADSHGA